MKITLDIFGVMLILAGGIFFLQGINILPGSFMTGEPQWAINGGIFIVAGIVSSFGQAAANKVTWQWSSRSATGCRFFSIPNFGEVKAGS